MESWSLLAVRWIFQQIDLVGELDDEEFVVGSGQGVITK